VSNPEQRNSPIRHVRRSIDELGRSMWKVIPEPTLEERLEHWQALEGLGSEYAAKEAAKIREQINAQENN